MNSKNICRLSCMFVLSCLVLNSFADDCKSSALSSLKSFFPAVSEITKTVTSSTDTVIQTAKHLTQQREKLNKIRKEAMKRMKRGEMLTYEQEKILGIESFGVSNKYQIKYEQFFGFGKIMLKRYFWLRYKVYIYGGKTYFAPNSITTSLPSVSSGSYYSLIFQKYAKLTNVFIDKVAISKEEQILGIKLPTKIDLLIKYSAYRDFPKIDKKNGKAVMRLSSDSENPEIPAVFGDFSLKKYEGIDYPIPSFEVIDYPIPSFD